MDQLILELLKNEGPLIGKDIVQKTGLETFNAWKTCRLDENIATYVVGQRYLRLDQKVDGFARLSPSIMREFLNYTVISLKEEEEAAIIKADEITKAITSTSKKKFDLAKEAVARIIEQNPVSNTIAGAPVFIIAGDVVFNMAHAEPRPEVSTGELVRGSDLDIIVVTEELPASDINQLDKLMYLEKYNLLVNPALKEELDYVVKDIETVKEQLQFCDFKGMVASKILDEGAYLYGSYDLYCRIKRLLKEYGISDKLSRLEEKAHQERNEAEKTLLSALEAAGWDDLMLLFYTTEEKEEIF